jgi:hypothetical protein
MLPSTLENVWGRANLGDHYQFMYASLLLHFGVVFSSLHGSCFFSSEDAFLLDMDFTEAHAGTVTFLHLQVLSLPFLMSCEIPHDV